MKRPKVHPAALIALFFAVLFGLQASFIYVAASLPDDRLPSAGRAAR